MSARSDSPAVRAGTFRGPVLAAAVSMSPEEREEREREVEAEAAKVTLYPISSRPTPFCSSLALSVSQPAAFVLRSFLSSFGI